MFIVEQDYATFSPIMIFVLKCILVVLLGFGNSTALFSQTTITACYMEHSGVPSTITHHEEGHCLSKNDTHQHSPDEKPHQHCHHHRICCTSSTVFYRPISQLEAPQFQLETQVFGVAFEVPTQREVEALFRPPKTFAQQS